MPPAATLIAVDIGNSRIKLGRFARVGLCATATAERALPIAGPLLPEPQETLVLALESDGRMFDSETLEAWCSEYVDERAEWLVASVSRPAAERFEQELKRLAERADLTYALRRITHRDVPLAIDVDEPEKVGIDRLLAALAANQIRQPQMAAVVVDMGTAITVDLLTAEGTFAGGAILPGIGMSARALADQTDLLPLVETDSWPEPPAAVGRSTVAAIEAGLYWGAVGAVDAVVDQMASRLSAPPELFVTGGAVPQMAEQLAKGCKLAAGHVPHLVIAGIALVDWAGTEPTA